MWPAPPCLIVPAFPRRDLAIGVDMSGKSTAVGVDAVG
jgi:hypothetical protein